MAETDLDLEIAQLFLAGLSGTELTAEWRESLDRYPFGGVHLTSSNLAGPEQTAALIAEIRTAIRQCGVTETPLFALDHEGGSLTPLRQGEATCLPGSMALGAIADPLAVKEVGRIMGRELASLGFNLNWAPVLDINSNPQNPVIGIRSLGDQPRTVVELGVALIEGMQEAGVATTAKHFPGHGDTLVDSHLGLPTVPDDLVRLESFHLIPFGAAAAAGVDAIMTAHILFPRLAGSPLDPDGTYAHLPATLNPAILERLLRRHLGFEGVIVTDALEMWGIQGKWQVPEAAVMALEAGADIPLIVFDAQAREKAFEAVRNAVLSGRISRERLAQSVARIRALREKVASRRSVAGLSERFDAEGHRTMLAMHAEKMASLAPRGIYAAGPIEPLAAGSRLLVVTPLQENLTPADSTGGQPVVLADELRLLGYEVEEITPSLVVTEEEREAILRATASGRRVVVGTINAWRFPGQAELIRELASGGESGGESGGAPGGTPGDTSGSTSGDTPDDAPNPNPGGVVVVALRDPFDLTLFPDGLQRLATFSTEPVAMRALAEVLAGRATAQGRLPVRLEQAQR